jgi:hypothetical protein
LIPDIIDIVSGDGECEGKVGWYMVVFGELNNAVRHTCLVIDNARHLSALAGYPIGFLFPDFGK